MDQELVSNESELPLSPARDGVAGIGGTIKQTIEDFEVEELPAYEPAGEGEHLFLWIEKRDLSSEQMTRQIARALGISTHEIGVAGMKDRAAITRQFASVPARFEEQIASVESENLRVLQAKRHRNKLRSGHLRGNRFSILVRDVLPGAYERAQHIALRIAERGFPNYFGSQRFGRDEETLQTGLALLTGKLAPAGIPKSRRRFLLRLSLSAVQSHLFNLALAERINDCLLYHVLEGDIMQVVASGGPFVAEDVAREQPRCDAGETVITGPMFGPKMKQPRGEPAARELRLLQNSGLTLEDFNRFANLTSGTRRPMLVRPDELTVDNEQQIGMRFKFTLPSGTYATVLLREFMSAN